MDASLLNSRATIPGRADARIHEDTFQILIWIFYALAFLTVTLRTGLRLRTQQRLQVDDVLLLIACVCLTIATIVMQLRHRDVYTVINLDLNPETADPHMDFAKIIYRFQVVEFIYTPLTWVTIFAAKFAYLWFFKQLISRMRLLTIYWWVVTVLTGCISVLCIFVVYMTCPYMDMRTLKCAEGKAFNRTFSFALAVMVLDVITDVLIVAIPIFLLWKVKIKSSQKVGLGVFLCLSIVMAIVAVVRAAGLRIVGKMGNLHIFDSSWQFLWQQIEACLAVSLVSLTAFRFFFIAHEQKRQEEKRKQAWLSSSIARVRKRTQQRNGRLGQLPSIPSATLSGLMTYIKGEKSRATQIDSTFAAHSKGLDNTFDCDNEKLEESHIYVTKAFGTNVEEISVTSTTFPSESTRNHGIGDDRASQTSISTLPPAYVTPLRDGAPPYHSASCTSDEQEPTSMAGKHNGDFV